MSIQTHDSSFPVTIGTLHFSYQREEEPNRGWERDMLKYEPCLQGDTLSFLIPKDAKAMVCPVKDSVSFVFGWEIKCGAMFYRSWIIEPEHQAIWGLHTKESLKEEWDERRIVEALRPRSRLPHPQSLVPEQYYEKQRRYGKVFMFRLAERWDDVSCFDSTNTVLNSTYIESARGLESIQYKEQIYWMDYKECETVTGKELIGGYVLNGNHLACNGGVYINQQLRCLLHGRATLQLASGHIVAPSGVKTEIPGVAVLEWGSR